MNLPTNHIPLPLLKTKLSVPPLRESFVSRPRLLSLLSEGAGRTLMLICAPAGYGKTTLLAEWIASFSYNKEPAGQNICWLSLDEGDNDSVRFLNYLVAAFENANIGVSTEIWTILNSFPPPTPQAILTLLLNQFEHLSFPITLVLDDYQFISNPEIQECLTFLLDHAPSNLHLVIATRSDPPLPLPRLRARNQLVEVRADALRFTLDQVTDFLSQVMQLSLSVEDISALETRTEGWVTGLQMAALSLKGRPDVSQFIQKFSGSHRYILDYLAEEVLNLQSIEIQQFLMFTSILDRFCAPLCSVVVGESELLSRETLEYLDRANLFLIALDDEKNWYRFHHLFADLLKARLLQDQPGIVPELRRRASVWFEKNGDIAEAIQQSFFSHDYEHAAELIEQYGPTRWSISDTSIMLMADRLPPEMLLARPRLGIYQSWIMVSQGQRSAAIRLLIDLRQQIPRNDLNPEYRWMRSYVELLLAYAPDPASEQAKIVLQDYQVFDEMPEQDLGLRNTADILYAMLLTRRGELEAPADILLQCVQRDVTAKGTTGIPMAVPFLARIRLMQGRLHEAATLCRTYLKPVTERGKKFFYTAGSLNIVLGEVLREWNELGSAEEQIREGIQANKLWKNIFTDALGYSALARVQEAKGDLGEAFETLDKLEEMFANRTKPADWETELRSLRVRLWLADGNLASASEWADNFPVNELSNLPQELDYLTIARVRLAQGKYHEAQQISELLDRTPGLEKRINRKIKIGLLLASALSGQNKLSEALRVFETCLALGESDMHMRVFLDGKDATREILLAYLRSPTAKHKTYAQKLLEAFPGSPEGLLSEKSQAVDMDALTPRERDVLHLMAEGWSNRQIAEKLVLAEGTVKFYVHTVLEKLQVHSRTQAILIARERNLI